MARTKPSSSTAVKSRDYPPPKLTGWGAMYFVFYVGLPIIIGLFLIDVVLYFFFKEVLGTCYGVFCLF